MKYDKEKAREICENLKIGMKRADVCILSEISSKVFLQWIKNPEFCAAVKKAETEAKKRNIGLINKAAMMHWQAAVYWLEHMYPKEFGRKTKLVFPGDETDDLFNSVSVLSGSEIDSCLDGIINSLSDSNDKEVKASNKKGKRTLPGRRK